MKRTIAVSIVTVILVGMFASSALAAPKGGGSGNSTGSPTIALCEVDGVSVCGGAALVAGAATPHLGGTVRFDASFGNVKNPSVWVHCHDPLTGALLYGEAAPYDATIRLGGAWSNWLAIGGPANCTADLYTVSRTGAATYLAKTEFSATA